LSFQCGACKTKFGGQSPTNLDDFSIFTTLLFKFILYFNLYYFEPEDSVLQDGMYLFSYISVTHSFFPLSAKPGPRVMSLDLLLNHIRTVHGYPVPRSALPTTVLTPQTATLFWLSGELLLYSRVSLARCSLQPLLHFLRSASASRPISPNPVEQVTPPHMQGQKSHNRRQCMTRQAQVPPRACGLAKLCSQAQHHAVRCKTSEAESIAISCLTYRLTTGIALAHGRLVGQSWRQSSPSYLPPLHTENPTQRDKSPHHDDLPDSCRLLLRGTDRIDLEHQPLKYHVQTMDFTPLLPRPTRWFPTRGWLDLMLTHLLSAENVSTPPTPPLLISRPTFLPPSQSSI
jgi:hypothetical protein